MIEHAIALLALNAAVIAGVMLVAWLISVVLGDVSFVDGLWGAGFVVVAWVTLASLPEAEPRDWLIVAMVSLWGLRLAAYLFARWRREGPDPRYVRMTAGRQNKHLFTLGVVFGLQGALILLVSLPVQWGQLGTAGALGPVAWIGVAAWAAGLAIESTADAQMQRFKADTANDGHVMDRGLWRYSRHPNYFGDACCWWGIWLVAAAAPLGPWAVAGPLFMTFTLMKWSGVPLLERRLKKHRPGYEDYVRRTSPFIPWPPKKPG